MCVGEGLRHKVSPVLTGWVLSLLSHLTTSQLVVCEGSVGVCASLRVVSVRSVKVSLRFL